MCCVASVSLCVYLQQYIVCLGPHLKIMESNGYVPQADVMTGVYVPYCKNKMASEDLLTSHRTYLSVSQSVHFCLCMSMNILVTNIYYMR